MGVVLVTGGTRGIGAAISRTFSDAGYSVAATYVSDGKAAREFSDQTKISIYQWDIKDEGQCRDGVECIEKLHGPIDVLINNAGIVRDVLLHNMSADDWHEVIATNLSAMFFMCKSVVPSMYARGVGKIINISSINGVKGQCGQTNYSAAKAGVLGFTKALALEAAHYGVTVNAIAPGYIRTQMLEDVPKDALSKVMRDIPLGRMGLPDEIASLAVFLASPRASFITGATFHANGGQWMGS